MKRARFSDEQIVRILQEADRSPIAEVAKRLGLANPRFTAGAKRLAISVQMTLSA